MKAERLTNNVATRVPHMLKSTFSGAAEAINTTADPSAAVPMVPIQRRAIRARPLRAGSSALAQKTKVITKNAASPNMKG